jgi:hypothetical protein
MCIGNYALNYDGGRATNGGEGCAEKNKVVVDAKSEELMTKGRDGGHDLSENGGCVGLALEEDINDRNSSIANNSENKNSK